MKTIAALLLLLAVSVSSFSPAFVARTSKTETAVFAGGKKPAGKGGKDENVFGGRGKKITVREDEDAAMWVEEDDKGKRSPTSGGGKGKKGK